MLKDDLYKIASLNHKDGALGAMLNIDKSHQVFEGHFPGQPVLPGAVMLQMVKEVLESVLGYTIRLKKADQIKFLGLIDPQIDNLLKLELSYNQTADNLLHVIGSFVFNDAISFKFKGTFVKL